MSLALAAALALTAVGTRPTCSWDKPGHDPFMGNVVEAVERYTDIPPEVRARLKQRMATRRYDEIATIGRDSITGQHRYAADIRDMHFGSGRVCRTVSRAAWAPGAVERGLVYCESGHCIIVPTVCRNVSRITRLPPGKHATPAGPAAPGLPAAAGRAGGQPVDSAPAPEGQPTLLAANGLPETGELVFEPPGAGNPAGDSGRMAVQAALGSVATGAGGGTLDGGGFSLAAGGGAFPALGFNPVPSFAAGGGSVGGTPASPASPGSGSEGPSSSPAAPSGTPPGAPEAPPADAPPGTGVVSPVLPPLVPPLVPNLEPTLVPPLLPPMPQPLEPLVPDAPTPAVPEPGTWALWTAGLAALALLARRRRRRAGRDVRS